MFELVKKKSLSYARYEEGEYVNGRWVEGGETTNTFKANVQPVSYEELQRMPEGFRDKDMILIMTQTKLRTADQQSGTNPDVVAWDDRSWQVQKVSAFTMGVRDHYEVYAMRIEEED